MCNTEFLKLKSLCNTWAIVLALFQINVQLNNKMCLTIHTCIRNQVSKSQVKLSSSSTNMNSLIIRYNENFQCSTFLTLLFFLLKAASKSQKGKICHISQNNKT
uniref:Secreted protein n=1 Tax=Rhizophora mucronata TaxID=61149 RepID=A0A2P2L2F9_RHIMU